MSIILTPFAKLIMLMYDLTGSYGISLILFCLIIRMILFPIFLKGRKSMLAMSSLADKQKTLQQKYGRDRNRYSQELTKLYEEENVKPTSGCLWSLLPMPFLVALYGIIRQPLTYLMGMTEDHFNAVSNLLYGEVLDYKNGQLSMAQDVFLNHDKIVAAVPDLAGMPQVDFTFLGVNLAETPHLMFWQQPDVGYAFLLWLIPVVSAVLGIVTMLASNWVNAQVLGRKTANAQGTAATMVVMPLFSLFLCFTLPAALGVYWIANSVFAIAQEFLNIPFLRKYQKKIVHDREQRIIDEKERVKREKKAQSAARKKAAEEMRRIQLERKLNKSAADSSRVGIRAYARGRLYDPQRYPTTPYRDPREVAEEERAEQELLAAERSINRGKLKKNQTVAPAVSKPVAEQEPGKDKAAAKDQDHQE